MNAMLKQTLKSIYAATIAVLFSALLISLIAVANGCTAGNPQVASDNATITKATVDKTSSTTQVAADNSAIDDLQTQIQKLQTAIGSLPTPASSAQLSTLQSQLSAAQGKQVSDSAALASAMTALTTATTKLADDTSAIKTEQVKQAAQIAQGAASLAPAPFGDIAKIVIGIAGAGALAYMSKNHSGTVQAMTQALANSTPAISKG